MKNTGKEYEELVQEIYQCFLDCHSEQEGFQHINVQHNVSLKGKSGVVHQIDVYWEFQLAGTSYKTLVEVKDWSSPVKKEKIAAFHDILNDIPGNPVGFFVSKGGFQTGAKQLAEFHGINLVSIYQDDFSISIGFRNNTTHYENIAFEVNDALFDEHPSWIDDAAAYAKDSYFADAIIVKPAGDEINFGELVYAAAAPYYFEKDGQKFHIHQTFPENWLWKIGHPDFPLIRVSGYSFDCYNIIESSSVTLQLTNLADYAIEDILRREKRYYSQKRKTIIPLG